MWNKLCAENACFSRFYFTEMSVRVRMKKKRKRLVGVYCIVTNFFIRILDKQVVNTPRDFTCDIDARVCSWLCVV